MPSDRRIVAYRPDRDEEKALQALVRKYGLPMSRMIGLALRQMADREGVAWQTEKQEAAA